MKHKAVTQRILAWMLALALLFTGILPANTASLTVNAASTTKSSNEITTAEEFPTQIPAGETYTLTADIKLADGQQITDLAGTLDGQGHVITLSGKALAENVSGTIQNLGVAGSVDVESDDKGSITDNLTGTIQNSYSTVTINDEEMFEEVGEKRNGVIVHSDLLLKYLEINYPKLYFVSSTTKVLTDFNEFLQEVKKEDFRYVVPDFRLNKAFDKLNMLSEQEKNKVEFLCNECCWFGCKDRKQCYEIVSRKNLGEMIPDHKCNSPDAKEGYRFSKAMKNPGFISANDIKKIYLPMGFENFKIEGRGLGSALVLEFLLYYMVKPEYQICVREEVYLDNMLDLF